MAYIWSYLRRYPKWLAMNFTAAILFVIANLGLPTVLARMIDDGFQCLFDFGDKSTSRSYYFLCGRRTWHTSRIRTCGFRRKNSTQMAHSLSPKPITMAIQTIPSVNYLEWIVT